MKKFNHYIPQPQLFYNHFSLGEGLRGGRAPCHFENYYLNLCRLPHKNEGFSLKLSALLL
jgi:hypothetical protein